MPATTQPLTKQDLAEALDKFRRQLLTDIQALVSLPLDDEPETDAERAAVQEARLAIARGERCLTSEEL
jgi:hypothetical protein